MHNAAVEAAGPVVEKFAAPASRWLGVFVIVIALALVLGITLFASGEDAWQPIVLSIAMGLVSWVVLVRPSVAVHAHGVLLRNMVRDIFVPSSQIVRCRAFQTLQVVTEDKRFHGLGVSRSARSMIREQHGPRSSLGMTLGGMGGRADHETRHRYANEELTGSTYSQYIETRISRLGDEAEVDGREPVVVISAVSVAALVIAAILGVLLFV